MPNNLLHLQTVHPVYYRQENGQKIAEFLSSHPRVKKLNYAGLPVHPGRDLHCSQVCLNLIVA